MGLSNIDFTGVVNIELGPGSWEELVHVGLHFGLRHLLEDEEDLGGGLLGTILVEDLLSGLITSGVGDRDSVMSENVVHNIIIVGTEETGGLGISGGWWWGWDLLSLVKGDGLGVLNRGDSEEGKDSNKGRVLHFCL